MRTSLWIVLPALLLAGCIGGRSPAPDYHMLTARAPQGATPEPLSIGVGPVQVAPFLERPPMVTHGGGSSMTVADDELWGEPLDQGIQRVTLQNLAALTGAQVRGFPWRQNMIPAYAVRLEVLDLDRLPDGNAVLEATWTLEDIKGNRLVSTRRERLAAPVGGGYDALADTYSNLLAQLAQHIAAALPAAAPQP